MQVVLWFAGLRGAMAFALAMNMPNVEGNTWDNDVITTTTLISTLFSAVPSFLPVITCVCARCTLLAVVIFTTVVFGGLTGE